MRDENAVRKLLEHIDTLSKSVSETRQKSDQNEKLYREAIEILDEGFVIYDKDDRLVLYNEPFKKQFGEFGDFLVEGKTYEEMTTQIAKAGLIPGIKGKEEEFVADLVEKRKSEEGIEKIFQTKDGEWIRQRDKRSKSGNMVGLRSNITALKEREQELEETTRIFTETTNAMVQGIAVFDDDKLKFQNPNLLKILNIDEGILSIGDTIEAFLEKLRQCGHYDNDPAIIQRNLAMMKSGEMHQIERETHYGKFLRVDVIPQGEGKVVLTYSDITDIKQREVELEAERARSDEILSRQGKIADAVAQGIVMFENDRIVFFNKQALETLELDETILFEEQTFENFLHSQGEAGHFGSPEAADIFINKHLNVAAAGIPYQLERQTGSGRTIRVDGVPNARENSLTLTFTDITDQKQRELELEEAKTRAVAISEIQSASANVMLQGLLFFRDGKLQYFNPRFLELVGAQEHQVSVGMTISQILDLQIELGNFTDDETRGEYENSIANKLKRNEAYSIERAMKNGRILQVDATIAENNGLVVAYSDITEARNRERELEETTSMAESAERAKSEFLANMSHEIRTPMNGVMGMAELLATTELDAKQKMFTDVIVKSGASLLTIINDILDFSKIDAGQMELDPAPFSLAEAIEDVATLVSSKVAEKDLELIVRVDPALPKMMVGDVGRIRQIVTNLLGNAVKFTEKGHVFVNIEGDITTGAEENMANLRFMIEDTGIGIPAEKCEHIFSKFSQVDTSATRKHEGTGLGLSISSSLVRLMGGDIGVQSEVGKGSTFWFTASLPVHDEGEKQQVIPGDMSGARVLVIDDNAVNRSILTEQMAAWKFDGASTSSGAEGLEVMRAVIANNMTLDLVILDYQMPEMSGAQVLETMRNDDVLKDIPVIMLTSVDSTQTNQRLIQLGSEANLTKPTRSSMLLETMLQVLANKRADIKTRISNLTAKPVAETSLPVHPTTNRVLENGDRQLDILVAEDNEVNQIVFRQILEETGLNFKIVENGRLAFATYKVQRPRLVLMDVSMPEMNGKEATRAIRKYERENEIQRIPIVGVTAHALKGDMEACIDAGMDDYLSKPVSPNKLTLKVEQWLKVNLGSVATG